MESINYIVILLVIIALLILFKTSILSIGKLMQKGEEFLNLEDDIGIYHNNVGPHMRSVGYEKDNIWYSSSRSRARGICAPAPPSTPPCPASSQT